MNKKGTKGKFYAPIGHSDEFGDIVMFHHSSYSKHDCGSSVMQKAREEGFNGTLSERLQEIDWRIAAFTYKEKPIGN